MKLKDLYYSGLTDSNRDCIVLKLRKVYLAKLLNQMRTSRNLLRDTHILCTDNLKITSYLDYSIDAISRDLDNVDKELITKCNHPYIFSVRNQHKGYNEYYCVICEEPCKYDESRVISHTALEYFQSETIKNMNS